MPLIRWLNRHPIVFPLCLLALLAGLLASVLLDARPGLLLCGGLLALWAALRFYYGSPQSLCLSQELAEENRRARDTRDPEPLVTLCRELGEARRRPDPELRQTLAAALSLLGRTEEAERELAALLPRYARVSVRRKLPWPTRRSSFIAPPGTGPRPGPSWRTWKSASPSSPGAGDGGPGSGAWRPSASPSAWERRAALRSCCPLTASS